MKNLQTYFSPCYSAEDIRDGEFVAVGADGETSRHVEADFRNLGSFFKEAEGKESNIKLDRLEALLAQSKIDIDPKLFASLLAFQRALDPGISINADSKRAAFYFGGENPKLSELTAAGAAECAEIALLAHGWLNSRNIPNQYFSGHAMASRKHEYSDPHAFIIIPMKRGTMVYDPSNPTVVNGAIVPSIYMVSPDQLRMWEDRRADQKALMVLRNAISGNEALYGVADGTNIDPERHFVGVHRPGVSVDNHPSGKRFG